MRPFSERLGLSPIRSIIQTESMDDALRNGLWNALANHFFTHVTRDGYGYGHRPLFPDDLLKRACRVMWLSYFKIRIDTVPSQWEDIKDRLENYFFTAPWNEAYDFVEFFGRVFPDQDEAEEFRKECNFIMERELSAYRFINRSIVAVTEPAEVEAIEDATNLPPSLGTVAEHLNAAARLLSDRATPDYRNSIKESISAVEGMCALVTGQAKADLSAALRILESKTTLHGALKSAFNSLYGFTSDSNGIRHALLDEANLTFDDAKFMLVTCSAFVSYLKSLVIKSGVRV